MRLPEPGIRMRRGRYITVVRTDPPNDSGNIRCIVVDDQGRLGWIMYYPDGSSDYTVSNVNMFRQDQADAVRAGLDDSAGG